MAITMTETAMHRLTLLKKKRQTPEAVLRLSVRGGGCSGLSYHMDFAEAPEAKDKIFHSVIIKWPLSVKVICLSMALK